MAKKTIIEKLRAVIKNPEAMARIKEAQKRAQATKKFVFEASRVDLDALRKVHYT